MDPHWFRSPGSGIRQQRKRQKIMPFLRTNLDSQPVFRIRIHLLRIRIRIQRLRLETNPDTDTDPDPIRIQGFNDQKLKKNTAEKKNIFFFDQKLQFTYPEASIKCVQVTEEACSSQKRPSNTSKHEFFLLLWVIFALLDPDPDPDYGSGSTGPIEYGRIRIRIRIRNPVLNILKLFSTG
jgi:hypothetical protein